MIMGNAYLSYKKQSVTTLTPMEIVVKLYVECERQMNRALFFIEGRDYGNANTALLKAIDIVGALRSVLDLDLSMGKDLDSLYEFFTRELIAANFKKDKEKLKILLPMVGDLRDAFTQISKMPKEQIHLQAAQNAATAQAM
ncbi:MAG: flagellar export chaperone FliS [Oscillospiraceae bacterium]|jgi:flagellar protein FliS|nr:flagellar export chaperone FliS [Oscillospiraceae bacterium]